MGVLCVGVGGVKVRFVPSVPEFSVGGARVGVGAVRPGCFSVYLPDMYLYLTHVCFSVYLYVTPVCFSVSLYLTPV